MAIETRQPPINILRHTDHSALPYSSCPGMARWEPPPSLGALLPTCSFCPEGRSSLMPVLMHHGIEILWTDRQINTTENIYQKELLVWSLRRKRLWNLFKLIPNVLLTDILQTNRCFTGKKLGQSISSAWDKWSQDSPVQVLLFRGMLTDIHESFC